MDLHHGVSPITFFCVYNISLYIQISSVHNTDTPYILKYRPTPIVCCFSLVYIQTNILYVHIFIVHIKNSFFSKTNFYLYITQILFENTFLQIKIRSFVFVFICTYTLNTIGIERNIIPCENTFKSMGLSYSVSPNPPMYIHLYLYINTRSCTYSLPCTPFKRVNNQVTLV